MSTPSSVRNPGEEDHQFVDGTICQSVAVQFDRYVQTAIWLFSKGRVDMACTPAAFYARGLPENEAVSTSNTSPATVRANGGFAILDDLHQKHMNMKYLGWTESGGRFRIYTKDAPKFGDSGMPDFTGIKLRDNPIYGAFFRAMNATTHSMKSSEVYPALEKGVVNASAWATIGLKGLKWDKFLRHGIEPEFYQTDIGWIMNLDRWKSLDKATQDKIQAAVIEHENSARARLKAVAAEEHARHWKQKAWSSIRCQTKMVI